ncbi:YicC family protein [Mesobaculum littorinae]|uniref:YicC family protein n=1 Tax=Mesobaculum littorinae TaxID=2486419 RepID=A0A438ALC2_9RHOB|nr:YicC/YloC family endoribonuclease [Mesobaculum littorinae]RVV99651.1 YicC family protein [Mesobaculum littorinae]
MPHSMTGFATIQGGTEGWAWTWEIRSVNGRGLDLRLRVPDWLGALDQPVRKAVGQVARRGNVTVSLRLARSGGPAATEIDGDRLTAVLQQIRTVEANAAAQGLALRPVSATEVMAMRGVLDAAPEEADAEAMARAVLADLPALLDAFAQMRAHEGQALAAILSGQLDTIAGLTRDAGALAEARTAERAGQLKANLTAVMDQADADPDRVAQELALLAVKADVTEELDRLSAHVAQARTLLAEDGAVGRKLDFLSQEFNREANTLCSKAQNAELTRLGLDLKTVIDQMREQIQNVE